MKQLTFEPYWQRETECISESISRSIVEITLQDDIELLRYLGFEVLKTHGSIHHILKQISQTDERAKVLCELAKRYNKTPFPRGKVFQSAEDVFQQYQYLREEKQERLIVVMLDTLRRFIDDEEITIGILNKSIKEPREIFAPALKRRAASIICVRNNTNGSNEFSADDMKAVKRIQEVGQLIDIPLEDYLIIGDLSYYSMVDRGII